MDDSAHKRTKQLILLRLWISADVRRRPGYRSFTAETRVRFP
jgi:hypothetical protein